MPFNSLNDGEGPSCVLTVVLFGPPNNSSVNAFSGSSFILVPVKFVDVGCDAPDVKGLNGLLELGGGAPNGFDPGAPIPNGIPIGPASPIG